MVKVGREQALKYMHDYTALPEHEIETEVDRYIAWPGQALSYYMGELAIVRAREKAEKTLGAKFNIRAFHDAVLELGSVPLPVVTARIDRFITEDGKRLTGIWSEQGLGGSMGQTNGSRCASCRTVSAGFTRSW